MKFEDLIQSYDERRDIAIPGDFQATIQFCVQQFIELAQKSIEEHGFFSVALSGGSTPKSIYERLTSEENRNKIDWQKLYLFWSDERAVPPNHPDSNYHMAMDAGFKKMPIPQHNIFRMVVENNIDENAKSYEKIIKTKLPSGQFDLVMLGMGEDGHTASLFPKTHGLQAEDRIVIANYIPQKHAWRMTLTFACINTASNISIYVLGKNKSEMVNKVLTSPFDPYEYPIQNIGTTLRKSLWIVDQDAASALDG
jgi:6-phosphogluconolactonase